jgi:hypothetical protein
MKLRITQIDHYGYNGRDFHPQASDQGLVVTVLGMEARYTTIEGYDEPVIGQDGRLLVDAVNRLQHPDQDADDFVYVVWDAVTEDGRRLQLIDHEVEVIGARRGWLGRLLGL